VGGLARTAGRAHLGASGERAAAGASAIHYMYLTI
jgi:hypothetical protein